MAANHKPSAEIALEGNPRAIKKYGPEEAAKMLAIGRRIAQARIERGMRQRELAEYLDVGERSVQAYEQGENRSYTSLPDIAEALGKPLAWFHAGDAVFEARDEQFTDLQQRMVKVEKGVARLAIALERLTATLEGRSKARR